jgi:hypothetical protein
VQENRFGLTSEERDQLAGNPSSEPEMDFKTSMLALACLLLICIMILAASFIARSQAGKGEAETGLTPAHVPTKATPRSNDNRRDAGLDIPIEIKQATSDTLPSQEKNE